MSDAVSGLIDPMHSDRRPWAGSKPSVACHAATLIIVLGVAMSGGVAAKSESLRRQDGGLGSRPGSTERLPVRTTQWPWSAIGRVEIAINTYRSFCTGTVVGSRTVVTAAHCLFSPRSQQWVKPAEIRFVAGMEPWLRDKKQSVVLSYVVSPRFKNDSSTSVLDSPIRSPAAVKPPALSMIRNDWAVLTLRDRLDVRPIPVRAIWNACVPRDGTEEIVVPGYGADRKNMLSVSRGCMATTDIRELGEGSLYFTCSIASGGSGSPVLLLTHGEVSLVGIATAARTGSTWRSARGGLGASATEFDRLIADAAD